MADSVVFMTSGGLKPLSKCSIIYLASVEAENPERVRFYLKLAEKEVTSLTQGVRKTSA
jgi:hypothetical protein